MAGIHAAKPNMAARGAKPALMIPVWVYAPFAV
jgi:hypothetical protein